MSQLVSAILMQAQRVADVDPVAALDLCDRIADLAAGRDDYCLVRGRCHLAVGDVDGARDWIARAMALGSLDPAGLLSLGAHLVRSGDRAAARSVYRTALAWLPDSAALHNSFANAELDGDSASAERFATRAVQLDPAFPEALTNAAALAHRRGDGAAAAALLRRALALDPALLPALANLGTVLQSRGRSAAAEDLLRCALRLAPDTAAALNGMGVIALSRGDLYATEAWFRRAAAVHPTFSEALFNLGTLRLGMGDVQGAAMVYGRADAAVFRASGLYNIGISHIGEERYGDAVAVLTGAAALDPSHAGVRNQLGVALAGLKRTREAMAAMRAALCLSPGAPEFQYNLGLVAYKAEDTWTSLRAYERSLLLAFHTPSLAYSGIGLTKFQAGDAVGAEVALKVSLALEPDNHLTYANLGPTFQVAGKPDAAVAVFTRALRCVKSDSDAILLSLAQTYLSRRAFAQGLPYVRKALALRPDSAVGLFYLGYATMTLDGPAEAERHLLRAVQVDPGYGLAWNNYGAALFHQGRLEEAVACFQRLVKDDPDFAAAHLNLAIVYEGTKRYQEAEHCYRLVIQHDPNMVTACNNLGVLLQRSGRHQEALELLEAAIATTPESPSLHSNLGNLRQKLGRPDEARRCYLRTVALDPAHHLGHYNLGCTLLDAERFDESRPHFRRAVALEPEHVSSRYNLACALHQSDAVEAAIPLYREVVAADGGHHRALNNLAFALQGTGQDAEAAELFKRAERVAARQGIAPAAPGGLCAPDADRLDEVLTRIDASEEQIAAGSAPMQQGGVGSMFPEAVWNKSLLDLSMGSLESGWDAYEFRWFNATASGARKFRQPLWDGKRDIAGKRLLVWREQGIGDEIMFGSCVPDLAVTGAAVTVECAAKLAPLFRRSFPGATIVTPGDRPDEERDDLDLHVPIGSLPRFYRRSLAAFPDRKGFLIPDPERVAYWRHRLEALGPGPYVGIAWRGRVQTLSRSHHYTQIEEWEPILRTPGITFVNMQYDDAREELARVRDAFGTVPHTLPGIDMWNNLDEVAALLQALDLLVSVCTAVMSIAGGVGVPTWLMAVENFGWPCLGTNSLPWYPSIRMFTRNLSQPWLTVTERVAAELQTVRAGLEAVPAGA